MKCKKCGSERLVTRPNPKNPNATDLFCADCGAWVKFANDDERRKYPERVYEGEMMIPHVCHKCGMTANDYQRAAMRTCDMLGENAPVVQVLHKLMPQASEEMIREIVRENRSFFEMWNGVLGLNGEAGECIDIFKKHVFQGHDLDRRHLAEELGDVAWYLAVTAQSIGYSLTEILEMNIAKLQKRYPDGFDADHSVNRAFYEEENHENR